MAKINSYKAGDKVVLKTTPEGTTLCAALNHLANKPLTVKTIFKDCISIEEDEHVDRAIHISHFERPDWVKLTTEAGIPLGTDPGKCLCGCRSYRVKGSRTYVSAWLDPEHTDTPFENQPYVDHIYERLTQQVTKLELRILAKRLLEFAKKA